MFSERITCFSDENVGGEISVDDFYSAAVKGKQCCLGRHQSYMIVQEYSGVVDGKLFFLKTVFSVQQQRAGSVGEARVFVSGSELHPCSASRRLRLQKQHNINRKLTKHSDSK